MYFLAENRPYMRLLVKINVPTDCLFVVPSITTESCDFSIWLAKLQRISKMFLLGV